MNLMKRRASDDILYNLEENERYLTTFTWMRSGRKQMVYVFIFLILLLAFREPIIKYARQISLRSTAMWYDMYGMTRGMTWHGMKHGMIWCGVAWNMVWYGVVWHGTWYDTVWCGMTHGMIRCGVAWHMVWYGVVWHDTWYDTVWCGMTHGMIWCGVAWCYSMSSEPSLYSPRLIDGWQPSLSPRLSISAIARLTELKSYWLAKYVSPREPWRGASPSRSRRIWWQITWSLYSTAPRKNDLILRHSRLVIRYGK